LKIFWRIFIVSSCASLLFTVSVAGQTRERIVKQSSSQPVNQPVTKPVETVKTTGYSRPVLSNQIIVASQPTVPQQKLIQKTGSSQAANSVAAMAAAGRTAYDMNTSQKMDSAIKSRYGLPYRYGSTGPNSYDCSGFVWSVFQDAGINFTRESARSLWAESEPVYGDDRFKFGTLVFFNSLGHIGIVESENGFYQASSSKGITWSPFAGYWEGRIVGYRRLKSGVPVQLQQQALAQKKAVAVNAATDEDEDDPR
jgi:cell wall-associated NlpC family hydrolase